MPKGIDGDLTFVDTPAAAIHAVRYGSSRHGTSLTMKLPSVLFFSPIVVGTPRTLSVLSSSAGRDRPGTGDTTFGLGLGLTLGVHQAPRVAR